MHAVLSLGSNMDDSEALLRGAYEYFQPEVVAASSIYRTPPWGPVEQGDFLNAIIVLETEWHPYELLEAAHVVERAANRRRDIHWGPRTLDVDLIQCIDDGEEVISPDPKLTLPHPWAHTRAFVLLPWAEVEPEATLGGTSISQLLEPLDASTMKRVGVF